MTASSSRFRRMPLVKPLLRQGHKTGFKVTHLQFSASQSFSAMVSQHSSLQRIKADPRKALATLFNLDRAPHLS